MPSPTRSLYEALDCARALIEMGDTDAASHGGWLGVILAATPEQVTELYEAAGMPVPVVSRFKDSTTPQPAQWVPHRNGVPQRVLAFLHAKHGCTISELSRELGATHAHIIAAVCRLRRRGVKIETWRSAQRDKGYRLMECGAVEGN
jgi:biotin operon repressor